MTDHANELRRYSRKIGHPAGDVPSVMLAAADEIERLAARLKAAEKERDALRARIEAMEKQEPAATVRINAINGNPSVDFVPGHRYLHHNDKLYLAPGAQPAPSVPDGFSREDLEAVADGLDGYEKTVNVGNVTGEGDDHLESTTAYAARFIRTMLAAAPEAKP